ncbi:MAG: 50S ribosomal protein L10 [Eubacterium sp.]|jgi:large subunit ribosomal protein L10|nr:50S ribosomal protein L10 [Eubacterium sp.]
MPSEKILQSKEAFVNDLADKLKKSACGVLADYKGINVADDTKLRRELRENGVDYFVVKNTLLKRAFEKVGIEGLDDLLEGATAIGLSEEDIIIAPKILFKQSDASGENFNIKGGFINGVAAPLSELEEYAKLPSKDVLLSKLLFMLQSPMQRMAIAISEIAKKNGEDGDVA